jgi:hypothetical protein
VKFQINYPYKLGEITTQIANKWTKSLIYTILVTGFIGRMSRALKCQCLNFGVGFIKFFQIIEILSKFLLIPVIYQRDLAGLLNTINDLGEVYNMDPHFFDSTSQEDQIEHNRFFYKMSIYGEYKNSI